MSVGSGYLSLYLLHREALLGQRQDGLPTFRAVQSVQETMLAWRRCPPGGGMT